MLVRIRVTPNSKRPAVLKLEDGRYWVKVDALPIKGRANERLIEILSEHFAVRKSAIKIISGVKGRDKVLDITLVK